MLRIVVLVAVLVSLYSSSRVSAQVTQQNDSLSEQLVPESFKLQASATAQQINWWWTATVNYSLANNTGMNLYLGIAHGSVSFGSCNDVQDARGALQLLPAPNATAWSFHPDRGQPHGVFVPAGGRASGTIILANCGAPNPGYPTAPLSLTLMMGKSEAFQQMRTTLPLSVDASIRQLQSQ